MNLHAMTTQELIELRGQIESVLFYRVAGDPRTRVEVSTYGEVYKGEVTMLGALLPNEVTCGSK